jgi:hypothetical protein
MTDPDLFGILHKLYVMRGCAKRAWFAKTRLPQSVLAHLLSQGFVIEQDDLIVVHVPTVTRAYPLFARTGDAVYLHFLTSITDGRVHAVRDLIREHSGARRMLEDALNLHHAYVIGSCQSGRIFELTPDGQALFAQSNEKWVQGDDRPKLDSLVLQG